jgi:glycosyltransferase involved in cell wall biosynthesis
MKLISVVTPCFNEEENVEALYKRVKDIFSGLKDYQYEHIFIDNSSSDKTVEILKNLGRTDKNVKIIVNSRNFGHIRSPFYGMIQGRGDAVIWLVADFQDPPEMILDFLKKWEEGYKIVVGIKKKSKESSIMFMIRNFYYTLISRLSEIELIQNFTGFGLYDKRIIEILRTIDDPYPYFRGLVAEVGFDVAKIEFVQPARRKGRTKNNFYTLFDMAMLGITNHSKVPLRFATMLGFASSLFCILIGLGYLIYKLIFWNSFTDGLAPLVIGFFFFASVQLFFIGLLGEYIGSIHTHVLKRPLVIEKERINF